MEGRLSKGSIKKISQLLSSRDARMFLSEPVPSPALLPGSRTPKVWARGEGERALREPISLGFNFGEMPANQRWSLTLAENRLLSTEGKFGKWRKSLSALPSYLFPRVKILSQNFRILGTRWSHSEQKARYSDKCTSFWQCHWRQFTLPHPDDS